MAHFSDVFGTTSLNSSKITLGIILLTWDERKAGFDVFEKSANLPTGELSMEKSRKTLGRIVIESFESEQNVGRIGIALAFKGVVPLGLAPAPGRRT